VITPLPDLILYGRPGCHLCEDARAALDALLADRAARGLPAPAVQEVSIDGDEELHRRYAFTIPVVALGGREIELATSPAKLRRLLTEVLDGAVEPDGAAEPDRA
jgi:glutaredoxin